MISSESRKTRHVGQRNDNMTTHMRQCTQRYYLDGKAFWKNQSASKQVYAWQARYDPISNDPVLDSREHDWD